ncbi:conserved hypothetical protein [Theileria orientalis strain Shintoku]|uniref:Uncharacterized protein n=1 Tax=Theileria orientalis strain Shintoku TaxID=869250 RepID=J4D5E0_THEOR|nr:conserved hypothetical protein [Theileria orientalis strain Shintoku]PVC52680.1 hypothetical protein MACL_00000590 [Theileria orientalis]BAM38895.1 conserved hypothetical protein [Theileria orientalis strain Shintoku]|eukprot:XP_009689196.1 conserved hypothetical protein [Theileria orientalis strain Shintoku]
MNKKLDTLLGTLNRIKDIALKFKNPNFNSYFYKKAEDAAAMLNQKRDSISQREIDSMMEEYNELEDVLNRQQSVQNMYYSNEPKVEK